MKKRNHRDLNDGIVNAEHEVLTSQSSLQKIDMDSNNKGDFQKQKSTNMNTPNLKSPSTSDTVPSFSASTYNDVYKAYRPKLHKQESLPLRGISSTSVNTSQSMPFNQPKLSNGKIECTNAEGTQLSNTNNNNLFFLLFCITHRRQRFGLF